jgi:hypothetical protein
LLRFLSLLLAAPKWNEGGPELLKLRTPQPIAGAMGYYRTLLRSFPFGRLAVQKLRCALRGLDCESGAKATAVQTLARLPPRIEFRKAPGVRSL